MSSGSSRKQVPGVLPMANATSGDHYFGCQGRSRKGEPNGEKVERVYAGGPGVYGIGFPHKVPRFLNGF